MKVCLLSSSDGRGGGYAAAYRLHRGLLQAHVDSTMLVGNKTTDDFTVMSGSSNFYKGWTLTAPILDALPLGLLYRKRERPLFSLQWLPGSVSERIMKLDPSIINLHWICAGYLRIETIRKFNKPIVWTLHDMWPFTGGCHYSNDCTRYRDSCGSCPHLCSDKINDISHCVWKRKARAWAKLDMTIVTPSQWLAECARSSSLFRNLRVEVIPNGLDTSKFKPINKSQARDLLSLPQDKKLIAFGALSATSDRRKGYHLLLPALQHLKYIGGVDDFELVIFGASQPAVSPSINFKTHYLGKLNDDLMLALLYSAADVFVAPSMQDNLPNTVMEALACGTPSIAFDIGGMSDMIEHEKNGYLAVPYDTDDFAKGIAWTLKDKERWMDLAQHARHKVEKEFSIEIMSRRYSSLYKELV